MGMELSMLNEGPLKDIVVCCGGSVEELLILNGVVKYFQDGVGPAHCADSLE